jgi:CO/xanthine dehydrogenase FAD-binding subunit
LQPQPAGSLEAKIGSTSTNRARKEQAERTVAKQKSRSCAFPAHLFEVMRDAQDWATVGVATVVRRSNGTIDHAAIALTNMGPTPVRGAFRGKVLGTPGDSGPRRRSSPRRATSRATRAAAPSTAAISPPC